MIWKFYEIYVAKMENYIFSCKVMQWLIDNLLIRASIGSILD
jgi:hypothetical protein